MQIRRELERSPGEVLLHDEQYLRKAADRMQDVVRTRRLFGCAACLLSRVLVELPELPALPRCCIMASVAVPWDTEPMLAVAVA